MNTSRPSRMLSMYSAPVNGRVVRVSGFSCCSGWAVTPCSFAWGSDSRGGGREPGDAGAVAGFQPGNGLEGPAEMAERAEVEHQRVLGAVLELPHLAEVEHVVAA